jgi:hypothetical protein
LVTFFYGHGVADERWAQMKIKNWIYVTGAPRSSTTFVGKILTVPFKVDYIHEPTSPVMGMQGMDRRFLYIKPGSPVLKKNIKRIVGSRGPFYLRLAKMNLFHKAAVIKDPDGCLLTEYLVSKYGVKPVILIRHPVTFVASVLRIPWELDLIPIRAQKDVVEEYFSDDKEFINRKFAGGLEGAAALWRALNKIILVQLERNEDWHFITHESLCMKPLEHFRKLYDAFDLPWSNRIKRIIIKHTSPRNKVEASEDRVQDFKRHSAKLFEHRLRMIAKDQRRKIFEITKDVAIKIYSEESFSLD